MSIANEIERLQTAKQTLKLSLESRGADIGDNTLDLFAEKLDALPYCVRGTFTPEEDTLVFNLSGLDFVPDLVMLRSAELHEAALSSSMVYALMKRDEVGFIYCFQADATHLVAKVVADSPVIQWSDDGCVITLPGSKCYFKAGYTYDCLYVGGKA